VRALLLVLCAGLVGCGDDPEEVYVPLPRVEGLNVDEPYYAAAGTEVVIDVTLRDEAGNLQDSPIEWFINPDSWLGPRSPEWTTEQIGPGMHRVRITPHAAYTATYVMVRVHGGTERAPESRDTLSARVVGYGGEPLEVLGYQPVIRMAPAERRAAHSFTLAGYPNGADQTIRVSGDDPTTYQILDTSVATVDAHGVITAVAVGTTSLVTTHGDRSQTVPVEITAQTLGPPGPDRDIDLALGTTNPWARLRNTGVDSRMVVDGRGYPHIAYEALKAQAGSVVIASWTGTGFGFETVSRPYEKVIDQPIKLAVDDSDRLYVVYLGPNGYVLAERAASAGPADWTYRELDIDHPDAGAVGPGVETKGWATYVPLQAHVVSVLPRPGGGVWVAYRTIHHLPDHGVDVSCAQLVRLAEVTTSAITYHATVRDDRFTASSRLDCAYDRLVSDYEPLALLAGTGPAVDVVTTLPTVDADGLVRMRLAGAAWNRELLLPAQDSVLNDVLGRPHDLRKVAVVRAREPGQVDQVVGAYCAAPNSTDDGFLEIVAPGLGGRRWRVTAEIDACESMRAFQAGPYLYFGGAQAGPVVRTWPYGGDRIDDPFGGFAETPEYFYTLEGSAVHGGLLFEVFGGRLYTNQLPPSPALPSGDELEGVRLGGDAQTPIVTTPPIVRADGSRLLLSDTASGALLTSTGPGQPWSVVDRRADDATLADVRRIWAIPGVLFAERAGANTTPEFARSLDGGATWLQWGSISETQATRASLVTPEGQAFVVLDSAEIFFAGAVGTSPLFVSLGDLPAALASTHQVMTGTNGPVQGIVRRGDEILVVTVLRQNNNNTQHVLVQRFGRTDGAALGYRLIDLGFPSYREIEVSRAAVDGTGAIYLPLWEPGHIAFTRMLAVIDPASGGFTIETIASNGHLDLRLERLADGRLAAVYSEAAAANRRQVVMRTRETSGWSSATVVRAGGRAQIVDAIAAEPGGGLLVVMGDNVALSRDLAGADRVIVRVPNP
jgi:hypothetical protein